MSLTDQTIEMKHLLVIDDDSGVVEYLTEMLTSQRL